MALADAASVATNRLGIFVGLGLALLAACGLLAGLSDGQPKVAIGSGALLFVSVYALFQANKAGVQRFRAFLEKVNRANGTAFEGRLLFGSFDGLMVGFDLANRKVLISAYSGKHAAVHEFSYIRTLRLTQERRRGGMVRLYVNNVDHPELKLFYLNWKEAENVFNRMSVALDMRAH